MELEDPCQEPCCCQITDVTKTAEGRRWKITTGITLRAIFTPTPSVMHVVGFNGDPVEYFQGSEHGMVEIPAEGYTTLLDFVVSSFAKDGKGRILPKAHGIYGDSQFYKGVGKYYAYNTCNKWTAKALRSGGTEISHHYKLTAGSVMATVGQD